MFTGKVDHAIRRHKSGQREGGVRGGHPRGHENVESKNFILFFLLLTIV